MNDASQLKLSAKNYMTKLHRISNHWPIVH